MNYNYLKKISKLDKHLGYRSVMIASQTMTHHAKINTAKNSQRR